MSYFDNLFNKNNNQKHTCHECMRRLSPEIEMENLHLDIKLEDPNDILEAYFEVMKECESEDEIKALMAGLFFEGAGHSLKEALIDDILLKIEMLDILEHGDET